LDRQLREEMQIELKRIQREAGITFVFVTHDQEEAMRMSDRIVVFNEGRIEQVGTPQEVYQHPATKFVAGFLGVSNILEGEAARAVSGSDAPISVRPERIRIEASTYSPSGEESSLAGEISEVAYLGANTIFVIEADKGARVSVTTLNQELPSQSVRFATGDRVLAVWRKSHASQISV
jgi:putative spermidine/putrescine transport system ATP-binding protein